MSRDLAAAVNPGRHLQMASSYPPPPLRFPMSFRKEKAEIDQA